MSRADANGQRVIPPTRERREWIGLGVDDQPASAITARFPAVGVTSGAGQGGETIKAEIHGKSRQPGDRPDAQSVIDVQALPRWSRDAMSRVGPKTASGAGSPQLSPFCAEANR